MTRRPLEATPPPYPTPEAEPPKPGGRLRVAYRGLTRALSLDPESRLQRVEHSDDFHTHLATVAFEQAGILPPSVSPDSLEPSSVSQRRHHKKAFEAAADLSAGMQEQERVARSVSTSQYRELIRQHKHTVVPSGVNMHDRAKHIREVRQARADLLGGTKGQLDGMQEVFVDKAAALQRAGDKAGLDALAEEFERTKHGLVARAQELSGEADFSAMQPDWLPGREGAHTLAQYREAMTLLTDRFRQELQDAQSRRVDPDTPTQEEAALISRYNRSRQRASQLFDTVAEQRSGREAAISENAAKVRSMVDAKAPTKYQQKITKKIGKSLKKIHKTTTTGLSARVRKSRLERLSKKVEKINQENLGAARVKRTPKYRQKGKITYF